MSASETDMNEWAAWQSAARQPAVAGAIGALYADLDAAVRERGPVCWASGRCCNFNAYGHLLYVTGLEIAWFLHQPRQSADSAGSDAWRTRLDARAACPFQINSLCSEHAIRPLGCRIYFCQRGTDAWQHEVYESFQSRLRALHDERALPYRYMEWRAGLAEAVGCGM